MHKSGRVSALKKVINQQERWTYTLNINYRLISAIISLFKAGMLCRDKLR